NLHQQDLPGQAEPHLLQAATLWQEVSQVQPQARSHRLKLAESWANLSLVRQRRGANMREPHDRAEEILDQLHRAQPDDDQALASLAALRINWAYVQLNQGQADAALKDLAKNVLALEAALRNEPQHMSYRDRLMRSHALRGQILDQKHRFAEAVPERERAVE